MRTFCCWILGLAGVLLAAQPITFDVVVYGGTAGGVMAAIGAAESGVRVALLEPGEHIGGMVTGGLSNSDVDRQEQLIGGLTRKFFIRVGERYGKPISWAFEPHIAEQILRNMLAEARVEVFFHSQLAGVTTAGSQINQLHTADGRQFSAREFIDSSYEGDLMKAAGVSYTVGREGQGRYGESLAGRQDILPGRHQFAFPVFAGLENGSKELLPYVVPQEKVAATGQGDGRFQSYCFRICLTDATGNRLPISAPPSYDSRRFALVRRYLESGKGALRLKDFLGIVRIPNSKCDVNSTGPVSTDLLGASWEYPEASVARRKEIREEHLSWAQGLLYFLANETCVPDPIRAEMRRWGLPKDEFTDTGHWPRQLYVREGRRMLGEYVLTQHDLEESREKYDSIGMAGYNIDIREVEWIAHEVYVFPRVLDQVFTEGYLSMPVESWEISLRALLPRQQQCSNLLVTACISASTIAYASFRMEPNYMIAGESAGVAAALAVKQGRPIHQLDLSALQKLLRARGQVLSASDAIR
jgi:FAD-dependent oxidoreductase family protein